MPKAATLVSDEPRYIPRQEAQSLLGVSARGFFDLVCDGRIEVRRTGRDLHAKSTDVDDHLRAHGRAAPVPDPVVVAYDPEHEHLEFEAAALMLGVRPRDLTRMARTEALPLAKRPDGEIVVPLWAIEKIEVENA